MEKRYNSFNQIHKALRAMLSETLITLQQTDFTDTEAAEIAFEKTEQVLFMFHRHAKHEEDIILPAAAKFDAALPHEFESEHEQDAKYEDAIRNLMNVYRHSILCVEKETVAEKIIKLFFDFAAFNLYHMNKEEQKINPVLWANYSDRQIQKLNESIVARLGMEERRIASYWMMKALNDTEIINWMKAVEMTAPVLVWEALCNLAANVLPEKRWMNIQCALTEGAMCA